MRRLRATSFRHPRAVAGGLLYDLPFVMDGTAVVLEQERFDHLHPVHAIAAHAVGRVARILGVVADDDRVVCFADIDVHAPTSALVACIAESIASSSASRWRGCTG